MREAHKYVWEGSIPLQIHLHESEVTTLPPPAPALILAPRIGYLPLLISLVKPHFSTSLPPGVDTVWFEYKGLPLKWHIPTGVLFDLLCAEAERPWNLTVHFRGYPNNILLPCEGEDSVKWSFINSLKEAAYIINGNCKNVMNMSQPDQAELWHSVLNVNLEAYQRLSSKLKLGTFEDEYMENINASSTKSQQTTGETDVAQVKTGRVPVRLYVWTVRDDFEDLEDAPHIDNWDKVSYINRPVEIHKEEGKYFSLNDAIKSLLPEYFPASLSINDKDASDNRNAEGGGEMSSDPPASSWNPLENAKVKLVRIQGIEPRLEIPFSWVVNNLMNPEHFLHICVCLQVSDISTV